MKKLFTLVAAIAFVGAMSSCEKCVECTHSIGNVSTEFCGKKSEISDYETLWEAAGYTCKDV